MDDQLTQDLKKQFQGTQTDKAILEVLLDIRELLAKDQ